MDKERKWDWSGKMIDCNGRVSQFYLGVKDENRICPFLVEFTERDGHKSGYSGTVALSSEAGVWKIRSTGPDEKQKGAITWEAILKASEAGRYAASAMFGTYESQGGSPPNLLSSGVIVLWHFA